MLPVLARGRSLALYARNSVETKNTAAHTAVDRERKLALPVAPNRLPDAPLPNDAPMSAPLPCWISTSPIMTSAVKICSARTRFIRMFILLRLRNVRPSARGSRGRSADGDKVLGVQRRATDQAAIDVGLGKQRRGVVGLDAAAVEDGNVRRTVPGEHRPQADVHALRFGWSRRLAGADGPHGFVGNDAANDRLTQRADDGCQLALDHGLGVTRLALDKRFADADDGTQAAFDGPHGLLSDKVVALTVQRTTFGMTDDDVAARELRKHCRRNFAGERSARVARTVLAAPADRRCL